VFTFVSLWAACTGGGNETPPTESFSIGGSVSGLLASGLVLQNSGNTVAVSANGPFRFTTGVASGATYAVTVLTQPSGQFCTVTNGTGTVGTANIAGVAVVCAFGEWTWMSGSNTINVAGVYGTRGMAAGGNVPGARSGAVSWVDAAGNLWLFGGYSVYLGADSDDLWRFTPSTGEWTWVSGSDTGDVAGVYGTRGMAAAGNVPGARSGAVSWIDAAGNLWLFGGAGCVLIDGVSTGGYLNDLWRFTPGSGEWTWVSGSNTINVAGVYGTRGMAAAANVPGARSGAVSWIDAAGNLWLFGGYSVYLETDFNDLWEFTPSTGEWTWMSGSDTVDVAGVYGTEGMAAAGNVPGARSGAVSWIDAAGNLWLFGGLGYVPAAGYSDFGYLNDLWKFTPGSGEWTWVSGSNSINAAGVYGTEGMAAAGNVPGARSGAVSWIDTAGNLWLFGGGYAPLFVDGFLIDDLSTSGDLNDLWKFTSSTGEWTWVSGSNSINVAGTYGTQGVAAIGNVPAARDSAVSWMDASGILWLFGGENDQTADDLNDLWKFVPPPPQSE